MREFLHNGERVVYQVLQDESFLDLLNKAGIIPEELPDDNLSYRVFKYVKDGRKKYACVLIANAPDAYIEKVYTTFSYPEDGFYNMMLDITGQLEKEEPVKIRSRLSIAVEQAEKSAEEWIEEKYPDQYANWCFSGYPADIQKEHQNMQKIALSSFGYDIDTLDKISAPDVNMDYIRELFK